MYIYIYIYTKLLFCVSPVLRKCFVEAHACRTPCHSQLDGEQQATNCERTPIATASGKQHSECHCIRLVLPLQYRCGTPRHPCTWNAATAAKVDTSTSTAHQPKHCSFRASASTRPQVKLGCRLENGRPSGRLALGQPGIWLALGHCRGQGL